MRVRTDQCSEKKGAAMFCCVSVFWPLIVIIQVLWCMESTRSRKKVHSASRWKHWHLFKRFGVTGLMRDAFAGKHTGQTDSYWRPNPPSSLAVPGVAPMLSRKIVIFSTVNSKSHSLEIFKAIESIHD